MENPIYHSRTKHILTKYHFIRDRVAIGDIVLKWVRSEENGADMFTKHASVSIQSEQEAHWDGVGSRIVILDFEILETFLL